MIYPALKGWAIFKAKGVNFRAEFSARRYSPPGFLEIEIRLMVGMLGALFAGEQAFDGEQLHTGAFLAGGDDERITHQCSPSQLHPLENV